MKSNLPSEEITDAQNPVTKTITTYTYDDKGNVKLETKNSAGEVTETKYKDKDGNEIESNQFDAPKEHTVEKGENITTIVKNALKEQGFNDEALEKNPDILKNAKAEFLEANKDLVKTYNGSKAEWKGNKYFLIGDKVTIPKFTINADTSKEVEKTPTGTKTATETESEQDAQLQKIQATLGDGYKVVYNQDGEIEVRDKDGNIAESATAKARDSITSDDNDAKKMIDEADKNNNKTLNIDEYRNYLRNMISDSGIDVNGANKDKIDEIINNSFTSVDTINADGELTQKEIAKNMKNTFAAIEAQLEENNIFE
jgi:type I site-specific restriction-modification system R (restriction) subunit